MTGFFSGTATAMITPFGADGGVNFNSFGEMIERQITAGTDMLVILGTTGEPATMTEEEKVSVMEYSVKKAKGRIKIVFGCGSNCTDHAVSAAKQAEAIGADGLLAVTPYYNKCTQNGLYAYYKSICEAVKIPVIAYNVPSRTGVNIQPATLEKICRLPQVVAVKEANPDVAQAMEKINLVGDDATFYCGNDDLTIPLMVLGFQGVISVLSNVMPAETSKMTSLALSGNWAEASQMQRDLLPMVKALFCETSPIPCKAAMSMMGMCRNELRLPLIPMQEANQQKLADIMRGWKLI